MQMYVFMSSLLRRRTAMLDFAVAIIRGFTVGFDETRFAIVKFSSAAKVEVYFNQFNSSSDLITCVRVL